MGYTGSSIKGLHTSEKFKKEKLLTWGAYGLSLKTKQKPQTSGCHLLTKQTGNSLSLILHQKMYVNPIDLGQLLLQSRHRLQNI